MEVTLSQIRLSPSATIAAAEGVSRYLNPSTSTGNPHTMSDNEQNQEQVKTEDPNAPINIKVRPLTRRLSGTIRPINAENFCLNFASFSLAVLDL